MHIRTVNVRTKDRCRNKRINLDLSLGNRDLRFNILGTKVLLSCVTLTLIVLMFSKNEEYRNCFKNSSCVSRCDWFPWQCCLQCCSLRISRISASLFLGALGNYSYSLLLFPEKTPAFRWYCVQVSARGESGMINQFCDSLRLCVGV